MQQCHLKDQETFKRGLIKTALELIAFWKTGTKTVQKQIKKDFLLNLWRILLPKTHAILTGRNRWLVLIMSANS